MLKKIVIAAAVSASLFLAFGAYIGSTPEGKERQKQKDVISNCWEMQGKKSLDPSVARTAASICEQMEVDYIKKWGTRP